ncbi:hypothetical protein GW17_00062308 [Ensete ventricosum]|nr:hypothetical protein GW17_00062308 [Ensete ventricosum]
MPGIRVVRRALAGGEMPTLPVSGRLYDTWRPSYNRSTSHVGLAPSAAQVSEGVSHLLLRCVSSWPVAARRGNEDEDEDEESNKEQAMGELIEDLVGRI